MTANKAPFAKEEELREALQERGHVHDCAEAGCTLDPEGKKIPEEAKGKKQPPVSDRVKELWEEIHGEPWPG